MAGLEGVSRNGMEYSAKFFRQSQSIAQTGRRTIEQASENTNAEISQLVNSGSFSKGLITQQQLQGIPEMQETNSRINGASHESGKGVIVDVKA